MSAYLCNPEHIAALAAFATGNGGSTCSVIYDWRIEGNPLATAENVARELAMQNINSVAARYPNDKSGERPGPSGMMDDDYIAECGRLARKYMGQPVGLKIVDWICMCTGYEYQSCESPGWTQSAAHNQLQWILSKAYRLLPGWDEAIRDFDGTVKRRAA